MKLDVDTVPTVPDAPPAADPDRALDPPPPDLRPPGKPLLAAAGLLLPEGALTVPEEQPATATGCRRIESNLAARSAALLW